jgi:hypothetical protein
MQGELNAPRTLKALRPFVPARDFALSQQFYVDIGFRAEKLAEQLIEMHFGPHSFLLQDYYNKEWASNFIMHALVGDLDDWWHHMEALNLSARYGVERPRAPKLQPWGLSVAYVFDPSGVLWHFAERPRGR